MQPEISPEGTRTGFSPNWIAQERPGFRSNFPPESAGPSDDTMEITKAERSF